MGHCLTTVFDSSFERYQTVNSAQSHTGLQALRRFRTTTAIGFGMATGPQHSLLNLAGACLPGCILLIEKMTFSLLTLDLILENSLQINSLPQKL